MRIFNTEHAMTKSVRTVSATLHEARQSLAVYDTSAPKRPTNVSINEDLLSKARELGVNLSQTLEEGLKTRLAEERRKRWLADNKAAFAACNAHFEKYGLWSDGLRMF